MIKKLSFEYPKLTALLVGAISATGFAPLNLWPLTLFAFAYLMHSIFHAPSRKSAFAQGWFFGLGHFAVSLNWIAVSFTFQSAMPEWLGYFAVIALALVLAIYPALATLGAFWGAQRKLMPFILAFAGLWIVSEYLRSIILTGFAWNPLGVIAIPIGIVPHLSSYMGTYGLGAVIICVAAAVWQLADRNWKFSAPVLVIFCAVALMPNSGDIIESATDDRANILIVQPNIGQQDKWEMGFKQRNFERLAELTSDTENSTPKIIFWPEAAIPDYLERGYPYRYYYQDADYTRAQLASLMNPGDVLLLGALSLEIDENGQAIGARNASFAMDKDQQLLGRYDKAHLVPFGEYLPMRAILTPLGLSRLVPGDLDFWPGPGPQNLNLGSFGRAGIQICYEIVFSGRVADRDDRPDFIFNPSNDAWFGKWGPPQHLAQAQLRAIEEGLPVIRSTPTGISAIVDANGRILESLPWRQAGVIASKLPDARQLTPFARYGNILPLGLAIILLLSAIAIRARAR